MQPYGGGEFNVVWVINWLVSTIHAVRDEHLLNNFFFFKFLAECTGMGSSRYT